MTYRESSPSPCLQGWIAAYWGIDSAVGSGLAARRILPDGCADLICDFSGTSPRMRWVGTMTRAIEVPAGGRQDLFGIRFAPGGLFPLLGAPLSLLTDDSAEFAVLPARAWRPPLDGWCDDRDFAARCRRADASLVAALSQRRPNGMTGLLRQLQVRSVLPSAAALADETGTGLRTLQRRFMEQVGVSPGQHLRWLRFERARQLLLRGDQRTVDIALAAGYSDQPHFVREFRRFAGVTPGSWC
jgi:AraC-like DNA-binding protein